jgi:hypothetical protein
MTFMKVTLGFSMLVWKLSDQKVAKEHGWVIKQGAGRSCCGRFCSCVLEVGFSLTALHTQI